MQRHPLLREPCLPNYTSGLDTYTFSSGREGKQVGRDHRLQQRGTILEHNGGNSVETPCMIAIEVVQKFIPVIVMVCAMP